MKSRPFCSPAIRTTSESFLRSSSSSNMPSMNSWALLSLCATNTISHQERSKLSGVRCGEWDSSITFPASTSGTVIGKAGSFRAGLGSRSLTWQGLLRSPERGKGRSRSRRIGGCSVFSKRDSGKESYLLSKKRSASAGSQNHAYFCDW